MERPREAMCRVDGCAGPGLLCPDHWLQLPYALRYETGNTWRAPAAEPTKRWLAAALDALGGRSRRISVYGTTALTLEEKRLRPAALKVLAAYESQRPRMRGDCDQQARPCPWVSCSKHLYLTVSKAGNIKLNFPGLEVHELQHSCALDEAELGGMTPSEAGKRSGFKRGRVGQIEREFKRRLVARGIGA